MRSLRTVILGTGAGVALGAISLMLVHAGLSLSGGRVALPPAVMLSAVGGGALAGTVGVVLGCLVTRRERTILSTLVTLALAAAVVLGGHYANGSLVPVAIYGLALVNGPIVARVVSPLCIHGAHAGEHSLG